MFSGEHSLVRRKWNSAEEPKPGDLIEISRGLYEHWAIYVGDGYVIHLVLLSEHADAGVSSVKSVLHNKAEVKKEKLKDVVGEDQYRIHNLLDEQFEPHPTEDILRDAGSLVGNILQYNVFTRNCEHFVTLLRYGKPQSQQVRKAVEFIIATGFGTGTLTLFFTIFNSFINNVKIPPRPTTIPPWLFKQVFDVVDFTLLNIFYNKSLESGVVPDYLNNASVQLMLISPNRDLIVYSDIIFISKLSFPSKIIEKIILSNGIPRGFILDPILFPLYIIKLGSVTEKYRIGYRCYTDEKHMYLNLKHKNISDPKVAWLIYIKPGISLNFLSLNNIKNYITVFTPSFAQSIPYLNPSVYITPYVKPRVNYVEAFLKFRKQFYQVEKSSISQLQAACRNFPYVGNNYSLLGRPQTIISDPHRLPGRFKCGPFVRHTSKIMTHFNRRLFFKLFFIL